MKLRSAVFSILLAVGILPIVGAVIINYPRVMNDYRRIARQESIHEMTLQYSRVTQQIESFRDALEKVTLLTGIRELAANSFTIPPAKIRTRLTGILNAWFQADSNIRTLVIRDSSGRVGLFLDRRNNSLEIADPRFLPAELRNEPVLAPVNNEHSHLKAYLSPGGESDPPKPSEYLLRFDIPVPGRDGTRGNFTALVRLQPILQQISPAVLVDSEGQLVQAPDASRNTMPSRLPLFPPEFRQHLQSGKVFTLDHSRNSTIAWIPITVCNPEKPTFWAGVLVRDERAVALSNTLRQRLLVIVSSIILFVALFSSFFARRIMRHMNKLMDSVTKVIHGSYAGGFDWKGVREWRQLGRQLGVVAAKFTESQNQRQQAEEKLRHLFQRNEMILNSVADGIFGLDEEGNTIFFNRAAADITGFSEEDVLQKPHHRLLHHSTADGKPLEPEDCLIQGSIRTGKVIHSTDEVFWRKDGSSFRVDYLCSPLGADDQAAGAVVVFRDITEQLATEQKLNRAQKLEAVGILAGGIAHDFNNILTAILGNISLARLQSEISPTTSTYLQNAESACDRARKLTQQLLTFSRGGAPIKELAELPEIVREASLFVLRGSNVSCSFDFAPDLRPVEIDRGQFSRVVENLVINADQAMPEGGIIQVTLNNKSLPPGNNCHLPAGNYLEISFQDTGTGISREHLDRIFDPYFTTKQMGSGLGLSICYSIIKQHGGILSVESEPGRGSVFTILLPAKTKERIPDNSQAESFSQLPPARVLLMDDDEEIRMVAGQMLTSLGLNVETCTEGSEVLELYARRREEGRVFDLVILDLTVPGGMGGVETLKKLQKMDEKICAVVSSGYSNDSTLNSYREHGFQGVIPKPYLLTELHQVLQRILSGS